MPSELAQIEHLINWAQTFDPTQLQNEDDVETKFVLPLFRLLGYPDTYRRGKYPLKEYSPGKQGRKPEIDNIYFLTDDPEKQGPDTSLLLIEAKEPNKIDLEKDIEQATFYGDRLKRLFYTVTNGHRLMVFKRQRYHNDECIFDLPTSKLQDNAIVTSLYRQLSFEVVKCLKDQAVNNLTHALYVELTQTLNHKPDLLTQIAKGDFKSSIIREGKRLIISKPKVAIECELPCVFKGGSCRIEFSNIMLRGLTCQLTHEDIVRDLLIGLQTPPHWQTRCFIKQATNNTYETHLGQTVVLLSEQEAKELCECIDQVGQAYKESLIEAAELLDVWDYTFTQVEDYQGFSLLSVKSWLWELMKKFCIEFDVLEGKSDWHIFDVRIGLIVIHRYRMKGWSNVILWGVPDGIRVPSEWVAVLYLDPDDHVSIYENSSKQSWKQSVGPQGIWTARHTHNWIIKEFIPQVLSHYKVSLQEQQYPFSHFQEHLSEIFVPHVFSGYKHYLSRKKEALKQAIINDAVSSGSWNEHIPFSDIGELKHLASYLHAIQGWLISYPIRMIEASLLRRYYKVFTEIAKHVDTSSLDFGYIQGKLMVVESAKPGKLYRERLGDEEIEKVAEELSTYDGFLRCLDKHVCRIQEIDYENTNVAELISRTFIGIAETGGGYIGQELLNEAIQVIRPLWEQIRFERRFVR